MRTSAVVIGGVFVLVGLGLLYGSFVSLQDTRELARTEVTDVGELDSASGEVILEGRARAGEDTLLETRYRDRDAIAHV